MTGEHSISVDMNEIVTWKPLYVIPRENGIVICLGRTHLNVLNGGEVGHFAILSPLWHFLAFSIQTDNSMGLWEMYSD
jgi:hypothetical protein